jgi:hypothetical protein
MFDKAAKVFNSPISTAGIGALTRAISDVVNASEKSEIFAKHPNDFALYEIGIFDEATGVIKPCEPTFLLEISSLADDDQ